MEDTEYELRRKLEEIQNKKNKEAQDKIREKNYEAWKNRPSVFILWKWYCVPSQAISRDTSSGLKSLWISVWVPWNCSYTYTVSKEVPSAVVTYFHNLFNDKIRNEFQEKLNNLIWKTVEKAVNHPKFVIEMMGLQADDYYLRYENFPQNKIEEMKKEIREEQFNVLDKFSKKQILSIKWLSHGNRIYSEYLESRNLTQ